MNFIWFLLVGALSGWLAGRILTGSGFGLLGNIIVGIVGGIVGGWLAGLLGIGGGGLVWQVFISVIGAWALLALIGLFARKK